MLQQAFSFSNDAYNALFPKVIYPLAGFSMTGEILKQLTKNQLPKIYFKSATMLFAKKNQLL